jgi:predicted dehydrogenase
MTRENSISDGASYAPESVPKPVVEPGEFCFAAAYLDHGHIYGQTKGLIEAGGTLTAVYEPSEAKRTQYLNQFGGIKVVEDFSQLLEDPKLALIASAAIPDQRGPIGLKVMESGKDYFTDKPPFTTFDQLAAAQSACAQTRQKHWVYFAERIHNEAAWHAGELIEQGAIGRVLHVTNLAPHRLSKDTRPEWFFNKQQYGGIITDLGSHQVEQFLTYAQCASAEITHARVANLNNPDKPGLQDFGEFTITDNNGASFFSRVDWFTPAGSEVWGDGRTFIVGTTGVMEIRKYIDPHQQVPASKILLTDQQSTRVIDCLGRVGFPFFGQMILDCLNRTEQAMTQEHIFEAARLSLQAQQMADQAR